MTTSPYDSLPSGNNDIMPDTPPKYVDVEIAPPPAPIVEAAAPVSAHETSVPVKPAEVTAYAAVQAKTPLPAKTVPFSPPPQYSNISIKNLKEYHEYILPFEESLLVPDTMPDMQKVLFAEGRAELSQSLKISYDSNDFLAGDITVYTVYKPVPAVPSPAAGPAGYDDVPVDVVKSIIPFKTDKCWSDTAADSFRPTVTIISISAEMINERKFIVRGKLRIKAACIADKEVKLLTAAADGDLVTLKGRCSATVLDHETSDTTEISQEITIREDQPAPVKILKTNINIVENHRQLTSGKLVINASILLDALYVGEEDDGMKKLCCLSNKTDFTQFIVMDDKTDPDLVCASFSGGSLALTIENKDKFMLQGNVTTLIRSYRTKEIDMICDAYHKQKDLCFDVSGEEVTCIKTTVAGEISAREVVDLSDRNRKPAVLLCGSCLPPTIECRPDRDRVMIEGSMPVKILALDEENVPFTIEHTVPVRGALGCSSHATDTGVISASVDSALREFWFSQINSHQMEINTVLNFTVWLSSEETFCTLDALRFAEGEAPSGIPMALYVVGDGDTLWDVAKRYKSDVESIAALNDLDPTRPLPVGTKLFISK